MMVVKKAVSIRMNHDIYNSLIDKAKKEDVKVSDLIREIINSFINDKNIKIIKEVKKQTKMYKRSVKMKKKILNNFKEFVMEYVNDTDMNYVTKEDTDLINLFMTELKEMLEDIKENGTIEEYDKAKEIYYSIIKKNTYLTRKLINYHTRRIQWIIRGKILPTIKEANGIEEYLKEKEKKKGVL